MRDVYTLHRPRDRSPYSKYSETDVGREALRNLIPYLNDKKYQVIACRKQVEMRCINYLAQEYSALANITLQFTLHPQFSRLFRFGAGWETTAIRVRGEESTGSLYTHPVAGITASWLRSFVITLCMDFFRKYWGAHTQANLRNVSCMVKTMINIKK